MNSFRNSERVKKIAVQIIMKAKNKRREFSDGDLFCEWFLQPTFNSSAGEQTSRFPNMRLEIFEMADRCRQVRNDGSAYYFLATAEHKTGSSELAYIYVEEDDWDLFRIYRQHIRKHPVSGDEDFLFLNSNCRRIYNPSQDLGTILERYGEEVMTVNDARHIITAIAAQHCSKDDQAIIHKMLTHTPATADKHYNEVSNMAVPHRRGIPIFSNR